MSGDIRREVRREISRIRLGSDEPVACALCGESEPAVLRRASRRLVEFHHLSGEANDGELGVFLCLTHHTLCSELMRQGIPLDHSTYRSPLERVEAVLRGQAIYFRIGAPVLEALADELAAESRARESTRGADD
jgi:hypothetical protein